MTTIKILLLSTAAIVTAGGSAAVATRDKWWPGESKGEKEPLQSGDSAACTPSEKQTCPAGGIAG